MAGFDQRLSWQAGGSACPAISIGQRRAPPDDLADRSHSPPDDMAQATLGRTPLAFRPNERVR